MSLHEAEMEGRVDELEAEVERLEAEVERLREGQHAIVAGVVYDLMGWLTSRDEELTLSATHWASPAVDALVEWASLRGLSLNDPRITDWNAALKETK